MDLFFLKKLIGQLLMPLPLVLLLMVLSLLLLNRLPRISRIALVTATVMLFTLSFAPIADRIIEPLEYYPVYDKNAQRNTNGKLDYIVVLGCGHTTDITLKPSQQLKVCSLQRLTEGLRIAQLHPEAMIITSGAAIYDQQSNAMAVKQADVELGFDRRRIIADDRAYDTEDEALFLSIRLKGKRFALVTNANHMPRAMTYFEQQGLNPIAAPTGFYVKHAIDSGSWQDYFPDPVDLHKSQTAWYEYLGRLWQWLKS